MGRALNLLRAALVDSPTKGLGLPVVTDSDGWWSPLGGWSLSDREQIGNDFEGYIWDAYKSDGIVFACVTARQFAFSEASFQWRDRKNGRPGALFGTPELALLENPWPGGTTGEMLARAELDVSLAGNFYATTADDQGRFGNATKGSANRWIAVMRPDRVQIIMHSRSGDPNALDARAAGYLYTPIPAGSSSPSKPVLLTPDEVCHYSPQPDPSARFRGMSWLTPVIREVMADKAASLHKLKFFENGATLSSIVSMDKDIGSEEFGEFVAQFEDKHKGVSNAYKTMFVGGGADVTLVGADLRQLDFKATQGTSETRIAAAARVHPVIAMISEGMQGSSLNSGNFGQARRLFVDGTLRPLWRMFAASAQSLVTPPSDRAQLWYDDRDIAFLREDAKDSAEIGAILATTIETHIRSGYTQASARDAVVANDISLLVETGLVSVQLQLPGMVAAPATNGKTKELAPASTGQE